MSKVLVTESYLEDIADAIREKNSTQNTYTPAQMATAISNISGGGSSTPTLQTKSVSFTPSETAQSQTVTADTGYDGLDEVAISVGAISSSYVGSGITQRSSTDLSVSNATVTVPAGYYSSSASKDVASGTAGTPTATKGTVSNHSVSVTPSVTNTTGYITGSTKTGTAVSVSASELVSGNLSITQNGADIDVTNYSTVSVSVSESSAQTSSGTVTGNGSTALQISCNFEPDLIYVYGNLSSSDSLRGIISVLIVKDSVIYKTADTSQSNTAENMTGVLHGITEYGGYATLSNNVLTIDIGSNTSSNRFASNISYSYTLIKWT